MIPDTDLLAGTSIEEPQMQQSASGSPFPTLFLTSNKRSSNKGLALYSWSGLPLHLTPRAPRTSGTLVLSQLKLLH